MSALGRKLTLALTVPFAIRTPATVSNEDRDFLALSGHYAPQTALPIHSPYRNFPGLITTYPRASHAENPGSRIPPCARRTRLPPWHWLRRVRLSESASIANHKCNLRLARYRTGVPVGYPSIPQCGFQIRRSLSDYTCWRRSVLTESDGTFAFDDK